MANVTRYRYFRNNKLIPVGCLAFRVSYNEDGYEVKWGISAHNPVDRWNRATARELAVSHLMTVGRTMEFTSESSLQEAVNDILEEVANLPVEEVPTRIRKSARQALEWRGQSETPRYIETVPQPSFVQRLLDRWHYMLFAICCAPTLAWVVLHLKR